MVKQTLGEVVASSMQDIMDGEDHIKVFAKGKQKKCCECSGKCGKKCPCKVDDGKCKKACEPCGVMAKKAKKACCDCKGKCEKGCPCKNKCMDCSMCDAGRMSAAAIQEMVETLSKVSERQDQLGLNQSAELTVNALAGMLLEISKIANIDINDVSIKELMTPSEVEKAEDLDSPFLYRRKSEPQLMESLEDVEDLDPVEESIAVESPNIYRFLSEHPQIAEMYSGALEDPERRAEMEVRIQEMKEPSAMMTADPVSDTDIDHLLSETELAPSSVTDVKIPAHANIPPSEDEMSEEFFKGLREGKRNPYLMYNPFANKELGPPMSPEEREKQTEILNAIANLDRYLSKNAEKSEEENSESDDQDFEDEE